ncbi:MAG: Bax inhibitor-1 family protein [Chthonomonadales bacterium]
MAYSMPMGGRTVASEPDYVRAEFIRKVYNLLFTAMLMTVGVGFFVTRPAFIAITSGLMLPLFIAMIITGFIMAFLKKTTGINLAIFMLYSALVGSVFGPLLMMIDKVQPGVPAMAGTITVAVFGGLSMYAITSKKDFSYMGGFLFAGLLGLIVAGILMFIIHSPIMSLIYSMAGVLLFCGFILYDTSQIMLRLRTDEAIRGSIELYLDFLNLFLFILRILSQLNGRD